MHEGHLDVEGGTIYYRVDGPDDDGSRDGPADTIVWMHGLPLNGRAWYAQVEHFRGRFRNVTFDLRGYGRSSRLPAECTGVTDLYVSDLKTLFGHLALEQPVLVAHASGAHGALRFAAEAPGLLGKLVVINGSPKFRRDRDWPFGFDQQAVDAFLHVIDSQDLATIAKALLDPAMQEPCDAAILAPLRALYTEMTQQAGRDTIRAFFTDISLDDDRESLARITAPTLILSSSLGREVPAGVAVYMRERIADARLVELPGTDHFAFATQANLVNRLIEQFIRPSCDVVAPPAEARP
ncbi:MAG: alpha/beta hydrolase [Sneathiellaceae bacterium]